MANRVMKLGGWRLLSIISWLAVAACVAGTIVSRRWEPSIALGKQRPGCGADARLRDGRLWLGWRPRVAYRPEWAGQVNRGGFRYTRWSDGSGQVGVPVWVVALAFAVAATSAEAVHRVRRRRSGHGLCRNCGYDLRATPGRCPECGTHAGPLPNKSRAKGHGGYY